MERNNVFYYPGEWREGFYVESKMRCAWAAEIEVLLEIDRICKKYGLTWYASHGTLLGAVRHKGFVPWDDDLDITMKRPDYMRFLEVAQDELPEEWILLHSTGKKVEWEQPIARVVNADTYSLKFDRMKRFHGCPYIVGVDIFPLDYFPSDPDEEEMQKLMIKFLYGVLCQVQEGCSPEKLEMRLQEVEEMCRVKMDRTKTPKNQLYRVVDKVASLYHEEESEYLGFLAWNLSRDKKRKWKKEWFSEIIYLPFEDIMMPVPAAYDEVLKGYYGNDYMTPKRVKCAHDYPFYKKQDRELEQRAREKENEGRAEDKKLDKGRLISFEKGYFKEEEREGFFIEEKMKRAWAAEIEVLLEIDRICKKHNILYFATRGTLLGAIRHKGYIPWDDDVDIAMKRQDYQRFIEVARTELPADWVLGNVYLKEEWEQPFSRIMNSNKMNFTKEYLEMFHGCPYIVGVDIFPFDHLPSDEDEAEMVYSLMQILYGTIFDIKQKRMEEVEKNLKEIEALMQTKIDTSKNVINQLFRLIDKLSCLYQEEETQWLVQWHTWACYNCKRIYNKDWYQESVPVPFENIIIPAPVGYDQALRSMFGDNYMTPALISGRHDYPFYKKQDELWEAAQRKDRQNKTV